MTPRLTRAEYERNKGEGNRRALRALVDAGTVPGLLGYVDDRPVAWCALGPREDFSWLARSRLFRPVDDRPVWCIVCLFIDKNHRRQGLSARMLEAACAHAAARGATCVEAYPVEPRGDDMPAVFAHHGLASAFLRAGFTEVARPSPTRPIMRREV